MPAEVIDLFATAMGTSESGACLTASGKSAACSACLPAVHGDKEDGDHCHRFLTQHAVGYVQEKRARENLLWRQSEHPHLWGLSSSDFEVDRFVCIAAFSLPET